MGEQPVARQRRMAGARLAPSSGQSGQRSWLRFFRFGRGGRANTASGGSGGGGNTSRRGFLGTLLGASAGGVVFGFGVTELLATYWPKLIGVETVSSAQSSAQAEADAARDQGEQTGVQSGKTAERKAIEENLRSLKGVSLGDAVTSSKQTGAATQYIVEPLAQAVVAFGGNAKGTDAFQAYGKALNDAGRAVQAINPQSVDVAALASLQQFVQQVFPLLDQLPIPLASYASAGANPQGYLPANTASTYLGELQQEVTDHTLDSQAD